MEQRSMRELIKHMTMRGWISIGLTEFYSVISLTNGHKVFTSISLTSTDGKKIELKHKKITPTCERDIIADSVFTIIDQRINEILSFYDRHSPSGSERISTILATARNPMNQQQIANRAKVTRQHVGKTILELKKFWDQTIIEFKPNSKMKKAPVYYWIQR